MRRRIGFGLLLIAVGVLLLIAFINGYRWDWGRLWPFIPVLLGLLDIIEHGWRGVRGGGGFLLVVGCFLLLFTMRLVDWDLGQAWPAILILLGLLSLLGDEPSLPWAIILIGGGGFLLGLTTGRIEGDWRRFWPVILILAGLAALLGREERHREDRVPPAMPAPRLEKPSVEQTERLQVLERIRQGEITAEEGAAILEGGKSTHPDTEA